MGSSGFVGYLKIGTSPSNQTGSEDSQPKPLFRGFSEKCTFHGVPAKLMRGLQHLGFDCLAYQGTFNRLYLLDAK